jgi:hypothetical protein
VRVIGMKDRVDGGNIDPKKALTDFQNALSSIVE